MGSLLPVHEFPTYDQEQLSLIPRKQNWDLKRDVEGKLKKLDLRTQYVIYELIKEKVAQQSSSSSSGSESDSDSDGSDSSSS